ncbi:hypothetical protein FJTKL_12118 [Diaporthe vaccinii]|uniref:Uncharacterized protein n=1 Tax=Diaporthe vaccinii TaxID=105482 RepID=A0ABR4EEY0_9PEZI
MPWGKMPWPRLVFKSKPLIDKGSCNLLDVLLLSMYSTALEGLPLLEHSLLHSVNLVQKERSAIRGPLLPRSRKINVLSSITAGEPCPWPPPRPIGLLRSGCAPEERYPGRNAGRLKTDISKRAEIPVHEKVL